MLDLTDRKNIFYWQTDRILSGQEYIQYFLKRQETPRQELSKVFRRVGYKDITIHPIDENYAKGNVNIVRKITVDGKHFVVRVHPSGVKNGYYYVEKIATDSARKVGVPVPKFIEIHEAQTEKDMDFAITSLMPGITMDNYLLKHKIKENDLLYDCGLKMAKIHTVKVTGYGAFDNNQAKKGKLVGLHASYKNFIHTGLEENLQRLINFKIITSSQSDAFKKLYRTNNFEPYDGPRLIHNDYADWNLLTDGKKITAVLDWDECHGGDPVADLACWSTFFNIERLQIFLQGYNSIGRYPKDYEGKFHYYRLRYTISKMALRAKRYSVDKADFIKDKLKVGKRALNEELDWLNI